MGNETTDKFVDTLDTLGNKPEAYVSPSSQKPPPGLTDILRISAGSELGPVTPNIPTSLSDRWSCSC